MMKLRLFFTLLPIFALLWGCSGSGFVNIAATGKPYEIFVVTSKDVWNGAVGDSLRKLAEQEVLWVNQPEPIFDLISITPQALNDITKRHRNLLITRIDAKLDSARFTITRDRWASEQIVAELSAPSDSALAGYISEHGDKITTFFHDVEQERMRVRAARHNAEYVEKTIKEKFDFTMTIPRGYRVANDTTDFLWVKYELPLATLGVVIYNYDRPKDGDSKNLHPVEQRNRAVRQIPGPVPGSYMASDDIFEPESEVVEIDSVAWIQTLGYWKVVGDFMGGPFMNYTTLNPNTNKYIAIDMFVYSPSPRYPKRNYIRQLESLMLGVDFKLKGSATEEESEE